ncbi:MAG: hypothetical protein JRD87_09285 [Deltaproteobacteria bacterium]|nr:hypothetical protein [Deltaproteobacteria bacterium]MBW2711161.1 hypothetical protein [Deltaproteobacteria bacterium]
MAKKTKKQKHTQKRKEMRRRQKARQQSLPKILRQDPLLREALNFHHPLKECLINKNWKAQRIATVFFIREGPTGFVFTCFLVDLAGFGLKDAWGNYGLIQNDIEELKSKAAAEEHPLISCDPMLAETIVYTGIEWARKWQFKLPREYGIWLRLLAPLDPSKIDLDLFGENGKPLLILDEDDPDRLGEQALDTQILQQRIPVEKDGLSQATLALIGDVKGVLIGYSRRSELEEDFEAALQERFGKRKRPKAEDEWIAFQDWFVLQCQLDSGGTVIERFIEQYQGEISDDIRQLVFGWKQVIEGLFEIKDITGRCWRLKNLINECEYRVYPTVDMDGFRVNAGDFFAARIVPVRGFHTFSGAASLIEPDGSDEHRAKVYQTAAEIQMKYPERAFQDNQEKLQKSLQAAREQYEDFVQYFGSDEVFGTGKEIMQNYQDFFDYRIYEKKNPNTGLTLAQSYADDTGKVYQPPQVQLPRNVIRSPDVGMLCDPVEGPSFLIDYRQFIDVFEYPEQQLGCRGAEDLVLGYLESDTISDVPFRRVAQKFPDNFKQVISHYGNQEGFFSSRIDDLMLEFKPDTVDKLPGIVVILDNEAANLSKKPLKEEASMLDRFKRLF